MDVRNRTGRPEKPAFAGLFRALEGVTLRRCWGVVGCVGYLLTFALPTRWDVSLVLLGAAAVLAAAFGPRPAALRRIPLLPEAALFVGAVVLTTLFSRNVALSLTFGPAFFPAVLVFYLIAVTFETSRQVRAVFAALSALVLMLSVGLLATAWQHPGSDPDGWVTAFAVPLLVVPNDVILLALVAPLSMSLLVRGERPVVRVLAAASLIASLAAIVLLQSRGGLLAFLVGIGLTALTHRPRSVLAGILSLAFVFVIVDGALGFPLLAKTLLVRDRPSLWLAAAGMFFDRPFLGHGPHTFGLFYGAHLTQFDVPAWVSVNKVFTPWPHNLYLEVAAESGLVGLAALTVLLGRPIVVLSKARTRLAGPSRMYASACLVSLVAFAVAGLFELTFLRIWVVVLLFVLVWVASHLPRFAHSGAAE